MLAVVVGVLVAGCAGYRLGPTNGVEAGSRSVEVRLFRNETFEPRLSEAVVHALRQRVQQDGTYKLATHEGGDVRLTGVVDQYVRSAVSYQPGDVVSVRDYDVRMRATVTAEEGGSGHKLWVKEVWGRATVRGGVDPVSAERQVLPVLADDLARNIAASLVDGTW